MKQLLDIYIYPTPHAKLKNSLTSHFTSPSNKQKMDHQNLHALNPKDHERKHDRTSTIFAIFLIDPFLTMRN